MDDNRNGNHNDMPIGSRYRPLSPWAYFGYTALFSIPVVGLIALIVLSFSDSNINRRNFARSYWCALLLFVIICVLLSIFARSTLTAVLSQLGYNF